MGKLDDRCLMMIGEGDASGGGNEVPELAVYIY